MRFDCLDPATPLLGPHFLEASAGTGKTFAMEHVFLRLLLENFELEEIVAVTFTKAAARELKERIRHNIETALSHLQQPSSHNSWGYLESLKNSPLSVEQLETALGNFDRCQIFTIHSFCFRMLQEFAFEAGLCMDCKEPASEALPDPLRQRMFLFLEQDLQSLLAPEQLTLLLKKYPLDRLEKSLYPLPEITFPNRSFSQWQVQFDAAQARSPFSIEMFLKDFLSVQKEFKKKGAALEQELETFSLRTFIAGSLFAFLENSNRTVRSRGKQLPPSLDWLTKEIGPIVKEAAHPKTILQVLQAAWVPIALPIAEEHNFFSFDEIVRTLKKALDNPLFFQKAKAKYRAAIIDEFQDTDPLQWDIFCRLFKEDPAQTLYLVGDPKQSIYRFRNADLYTYLRAKNMFRPEEIYHLDINFRSTPPLIHALNALFHRDFLKLPKQGTSLPYVPVTAGSSISTPFTDEKGALHFFSSNTPLDFVHQEIVSLYPCVKRYDAFAILVKDRFELEEAQSFLRARAIPAIARSRIKLGDTPAFQAWKELFFAFERPHQPSHYKLALAGPFFQVPLHELDTPPEETKMQFLELWLALCERGLDAFFQRFIALGCWDRMMSQETSFSLDSLQWIELLLQEAQQEPFSLYNLSRLFQRVERSTIERRAEAATDAVQIVTIHSSKGLEFEIVFALGLASSTPKAEEETEEASAEKMRQLYVGMTRAKQRLYVLCPSEESSSRGEESPMELFLQQLPEGRGTLEILSQTESLRFERHEGCTPLRPQEVALQSVASPERPPTPIQPPSILLSFTALSKVTPMPKRPIEATHPIEAPPSIHTLPRGTDTGILLHRIFEQYFNQKELSLETILLQELSRSSLLPWKQPLQEMFHSILASPLKTSFPSLSELPKGSFQAETEFLFSHHEHWMKGTIDLLFLHAGKFYFMDWKSNWLGNDESSYHELALRTEMEHKNYYLQAKIYREAVERAFPEIPFGGALYLFLRGAHAPHRGLVCLHE